jgi:two-component system nitrate/nitrite response regulator NarL
MRKWLDGLVSDEKVSRESKLMSLTPRERDVCVKVAEGLSAKEIARELGISFRTVETHVQNLRRKYGANNRFHLQTLILRGEPTE